MKKRIISLALSAITAVSAVSAMSANALHPWGMIDEEFMDKAFENAVEIEGYEWLGCCPTDFTYAETDNSHLTIYEVSEINDTVGFTINSAEYTSEIEEKIKSIDENFKARISKSKDNTQYVAFSTDKITFDIAKEIREIVGDKCLDFNYEYNRYSYHVVNFEYLLSYADFWYNKKTGEHTQAKEIINDYVNSNIPDVELVSYKAGDKDFRGTVVWRDMTYVVPETELSLDEQLEIVEEIYQATGFTPCCIALENAPPSYASTIVLTDYLNGDANRDKITTIADAAAIMQAIANPDKYALSDLGEFNADFACDGLTVDDAVAIQKKLAGLK
ncbi:MAG: hypothetical protein IJN43_00750 [Ruminococcus sp.]|nr:hypothetical protein [Ruminococcus sp.]